ncbi:MAG: hypothetical protein A2Y86_08300 [Candidatus Aminicenantes bacterium RBG_13_62_12]|nr:MAG: hypothetical protein A2Y86_08300 [Candidatus Aminicenantes bacterium RBG_13_62_12]
MLLIAVLTPVAVTTYTLLTLPDVSDLKTKNPSSTAFMRSRQEEARRKGRAIVIQKEWVDFAGIPELLKEAVRITEDASFYWHKGIDFEEIKESIKRDIREKRFARGGSTITQQLAKNIFLSPSKNPRARPGGLRGPGRLPPLFRQGCFRAFRGGDRTPDGRHPTPRHDRPARIHGVAQLAVPHDPGKAQAL